MLLAPFFLLLEDLYESRIGTNKTFYIAIGGFHGRNCVPQPLVFVHKLNRASVLDFFAPDGCDTLLFLNVVVLLHGHLIELADHQFRLLVLD